MIDWIARARKGAARRICWLTTAGLLLVASLPAGATTILLVGDSLSSGYGLGSEGWAALANRQLEADGSEIRIVNDSISGDTTAGGLARIGDGIARVSPDWVMIELGGNDGLRGVMPDVIAGNLRRMIDIARDAGAKTLLLGIRIPPNYGAAYTERFEQVFEDVSGETGTPLLPFFIGELALDPGYMQSDMIHPNDAAQPLIRDRVMPFILEHVDG